MFLISFDVCLHTLTGRRTPFSDQRWHYTFTAQCFSPVLEIVATPNPPPYPEILALDARIRNFEVPEFMQVTPGTSSGNGLCLVQIWTHMTREVGTSY